MNPVLEGPTVQQGFLSSQREEHFHLALTLPLMEAFILFWQDGKPRWIVGRSDWLDDPGFREVMWLRLRWGSLENKAFSFLCRFRDVASLKYSESGSEGNFLLRQWLREDACVHLHLQFRVHVRIIRVWYGISGNHAGGVSQQLTDSSVLFWAEPESRAVPRGYMGGL